MIMQTLVKCSKNITRQQQKEIFDDKEIKSTLDDNRERQIERIRNMKPQTNTENNHKPVMMNFSHLTEGRIRILHVTGMETPETSFFRICREKLLFK